MSDGAHLLIPCAASASEGCREARRSLALPHLEKLLARLAPSASVEGTGHDLSMPHERVLARALGLPDADGEIPWAAWQSLGTGGDPATQAHAWFTPCHWRVNTDHIVMDPPQALALSAAESRQLLEAMSPYFAEDGLAVTFDTPTRWLARGEVFRGLATASLDRVIGRTVDPWLPRAPQARTVRRLQQEMQMLLYTHPVNEARSSAGQFPVNSFWVSGTGALADGFAPRAAPAPRVVEDLREAAQVDDGAAWAAAWRRIDEQELAPLLEAIDRGETISLTLCGDSHARSFSGTGGGWWGRVKGVFAGARAHSVLDTL